MRTLRRLIAPVLACTGLMLAAPATRAAPSPQEILVASDAVRNPDFPFGLTNTLTEYRQGKQNLTP